MQIYKSIHKMFSQYTSIKSHENQKPIELLNMRIENQSDY